ncbi:unnamed protein product [Clonostachys byssicola]|uniref:Dihydrofolate reductase n=1 Tax=Clonostachys byssicola TaxID=160290 RepID=A0A9N9XY75_9HYPO|nr:unnamed protein product [Clonostachys byssicola]
MSSQELTLIVAATKSMGIGANGSMPWQGLRKEMQYFARVTTRLPPENEVRKKLRKGSWKAAPGSVNAVIMGRKTWDSIPPKFRPLKDRLNIVVTRSARDTLLTPLPPKTLPLTEPLRVSSLERALMCADARCGDGRVFVMGGAQIYEAALARREARRVLLTSIGREYGCDTHFPLHLTCSPLPPLGWRRMDRAALEAWTGEQVEEGGQEEAGIKYEFQMWEKIPGSEVLNIRRTFERED